MSGRTYTWSKFHNRVNVPDVVRMRQRNDLVQFTAIIGFATIIFICILEVIFQATS